MKDHAAPDDLVPAECAARKDSPRHPAPEFYVLDSVLRRAHRLAEGAGLAQVDVPQLVLALAQERPQLRDALARRGIDPAASGGLSAAPPPRDHYGRNSAFASVPSAGIAVSSEAARLLRELRRTPAAVDHNGHGTTPHGTPADTAADRDEALAGMLMSGFAGHLAPGATAPAARGDDGPERPPAAALVAKAAGEREARRIENSAALRDEDDPLTAFGLDLTSLAHRAAIDPVVGRAAEVDMLLRVLGRRRKCNPLLVGPPGVGKTALAEALATRLASGNVPEKLRSSRLVAIDLAALLSGTRYRGEFEGRVTALLNHATVGARAVVLFIDELHLIVGAGAAEGGLDAASMLLPALARGEIAVIGACTPDEYRATFAVDSALSRRFQPIWVREPTPAEAVQMLAAVAGKYEYHHGITIAPAALREAVDRSVELMPGRHLPDKAIDLLDDACALVAARAAAGAETVVAPADVRRAAEDRRLLSPPDDDLPASGGSRAARLWSRIGRP